MMPNETARLALIARLKEEAKARMQAQRAEREAGAARHGTTPEALLLLPGIEGSLAPVGPERVAAVAAHIRSLLADGPLPAPVPPPVEEHHPVADRACGLCRGTCCAKLGRQEHFYMRTETLARVAAAHPGADLPALYAAHVPAEAVADSCVFHLADGCALPRSMRSDVCNSFWCTPVRRMIREREQVTLMVAEQADGTVRRAAV